MTDHARPVALVTGATRGIGRAVAQDLGRTHRVIVHGRDLAAVDALAASLPDAVGWAADLAAGGLADLVPKLDRLDVLVHSAGVIGGDAVATTPVDEWRRVFEVNVFAVAEVTRALLPALRAAQGQVVLVNSGSGFTANPTGGVYAGSKFALRALGDALREEERPHGVRVSSVHPGRVATDMQRELRAKEGGEYDETRYLEPASVARAVRLVVDQTRDGTLESVSLRPFGG
ncbi:SDR family oxidoreductase [Clavibacter nebraskensis]|uniref:SDR family oxidoreductase n=1 Tax=Clavibacter nebraskensis TaxID=31963 RepID=UPI003F4CAFE3